MTVPTKTPLPVVLVVEDEALVRMLAVDVLEEAGFEVLEASTAD
jgi:two-component system, response regulator PdtaR